MQKCGFKEEIVCNEIFVKQLMSEIMRMIEETHVSVVFLFYSYFWEHARILSLNSDVIINKRAKKFHVIEDDLN